MVLPVCLPLALLWLRSCRIDRGESGELFEELKRRPEQSVFALGLHGSLVCFLVVILKMPRELRSRVAILSSPSRDGRLVAESSS